MIEFIIVSGLLAGALILNLIGSALKYWTWTSRELIAAILFTVSLLIWSAIGLGDMRYIFGISHISAFGGVSFVRNKIELHMMALLFVRPALVQYVVCTRKHIYFPYITCDDEEL